MGLTRSSTTLAPLPAWQPLTFGGVAAFAEASLGRTLLIAGAVAFLLGASVLRFVAAVWAPALEVAIKRLPAQGRIDTGRLVWPTNQSAALVDNAFVAISVRPGDAPLADQSADLQFEFGPAALQVSSLLGYVAVPYPARYVMPLNRTELEPLWGAWRPHLLLGVAAGTFLGLLAGWIVLAALLALPVRAYALLLGRDVSLGGGWRLAVAALLPGALMMGGALVAYSLRRLSLGELLLANGLHLLIDVAYLLISPLRLPGIAPASPFRATATAESDAPGNNPFHVAPAVEDTTAPSVGSPPPVGDASDPSEAQDVPEPPTHRTFAPPPPRPSNDPDNPFNPS